MKISPNSFAHFRVMIIQDYKRVDIMEWLVLSEEMRKTYKPHNPTDWSGLNWHGNGTMVPLSSPICGWKNELCVEEKDNAILISVCVVISVFVCGVVVVSVFVIRRHQYENNLKNIAELAIHWSELQNIVLHKPLGSTMSFCITPTASDASLDVIHDIKRSIQGKHIQVMEYQGQNVIIKHLGQTPINLQDRNVLIDLKNMKDLSHDNVNGFICVCNDHPNICYIMCFALRGTLQDILSDDDISLTRDFQVSFILDIACGMWYLHQSPIGYHGHLTSAHCVVDSRWTCKVTGHGLNLLKTIQKEYGDNQAGTSANKLLWTAPEQLRNAPLIHETNIFQNGDVYGFSIITQEVFLVDEPYGKNHPYLDIVNVIDNVKQGTHPPYRPTIPQGPCPDGWIKLMEDCWEENPIRRPNFTEVLTQINSIHRYKNLDLVDNMIKRLEKHTHNLEERVLQRSGELQGEKDKVDVLLHELLPSSVATALSAGKQVAPETFDDATLFISDIVGFTRISQRASPLEVTTMLNSMYTLFDDIAYNFDVYKVATIGDAYMVASGLPIRNGDKHAEEICRMAIALLEAITDFSIPHIPSEHLQMRVGIHSGPCVAGVIGTKMPRYLLFGDTIDVTANMESSGEAMKIHVSETTQKLLPEKRSFYLMKRGECFFKGKGCMLTYWIKSKNK